MALAATISGADGIMFETHSSPEAAFSDGHQTLDHIESRKLIGKIRQVYGLRMTIG